MAITLTKLTILIKVKHEETLHHFDSRIRINSVLGNENAVLQIHKTLLLTLI